MYSIQDKTRQGGVEGKEKEQNPDQTEQEIESSDGGQARDTSCRRDAGEGEALGEDAGFSEENSE